MLSKSVRRCTLGFSINRQTLQGQRQQRPFWKVVLLDDMALKYFAVLDGPTNNALPAIHPFFTEKFLKVFFDAQTFDER